MNVCFSCLEKITIVHSLRSNGGDLSKTAKALHIKRSELWRLIKLHNIKESVKGFIS